MKDSLIKRKLVSIYEFVYEKQRVLYLRLCYHVRIMSPDQTIRYIEKHHCSIARFGDGEFDLILNLKDIGFQQRSSTISEGLSKVLENKNPALLLCIPRCMNTIKECNDHSALFWIDWGRNGHHQQIIEMIRNKAGKMYRFGDSQITRPYIDWKTDKRAVRLFPRLKHLWEDRDIIIVEGDQTRLGIGNDLFSGARTIQRVIAPAVNAFEYLEDIKTIVLERYQGELILLALGPSATILASEFADMGIQALDIGNIDIEYEWFLRGAKERIPIPGKFTNEAKDGIGRVYSECKDDNYNSQIVARIGC